VSIALVMVAHQRQLVMVRQLVMAAHQMQEQFYPDFQIP